MTSGDFLTCWNAITARKARGGKRTIFRYFTFLDRSFRSLTLGKNHLHSQLTFQLKARLYVNFIAVRKYNFLHYFLFCFVYEVFAVTIPNIIP